jgi:hypothetical protein
MTAASSSAVTQQKERGAICASPFLAPWGRETWRAPYCIAASMPQSASAIRNGLLRMYASVQTPFAGKRIVGAGGPSTVDLERLRGVESWQEGFWRY